MKKILLPIVFRVLSWPWKLSLNVNIKVTDSNGRSVFNSSKTIDVDSLTRDQLLEKIKELRPEIQLNQIKEVSLDVLRALLKEIH